MCLQSLYMKWSKFYRIAVLIKHLSTKHELTFRCSFFFQVNLFFLLNIVRVLITKLKVTHQAESNLYMKAVRATLILVPLLGIEFVLFPWRPEGRVAEEVYDYVMHILMHYQVRNSCQSREQRGKFCIEFAWRPGFPPGGFCNKWTINTGSLSGACVSSWTLPSVGWSCLTSV